MPLFAQTEESYRSVHNAFYVHAPGMFYDYVWAICVISLADDNHISLYELTKEGGELVKEVDLDAQQIFRYNGSEERARNFKIVSTDSVSVSLHGGQINAPWDWGLGWGSGSTFYTAKSGSFIGKEFIFAPLPNTRVLLGDLIVDQSTPMVFALDDCEVTLEGSYGPVDEWFMFADSSKELNPVTAGVVHRLVSSGDVLLATFNNNSFTVVPSLSGELTGATFITRPELQNQTDDPLRLFGGLVVYPYEDCEVSVRTLEGRDLLKSLSLNPGDYEFISDLPLVDVYVEATGTIALWSASARGSPIPANLGDDVTFLAGIGTLRFFAPSYAMAFAPEDLEFTLDGSTVGLEKDRYSEIKGGYHVIETDKPLIIEIVALSQLTGQGSGPNSFGTTVLTVGSAVAEAPAKAEAGLDLTPIIAGIAVAAIAIVVVLLRMRAKKA